MVNVGRARARKNRENLKPIIDTIKTCGRLGLPLHGHDDSSAFHPEVGGTSGCVGNFVELLNYRVRGGDKALEAHMKFAPKNATYKSPLIQNELVSVCGDLILIDITDEVKKNNFFSVLGDEVRDIAGMEQMGVILRYVNSSCDIREDFVKFIHCKDGLSGESLENLLLKCLAELGLDLENCRGQGYDGAGNVAGCRNGLSARILAKNSKAIYTHCYNHRLNLSVCKGCVIPCVRNMMDEVGNLSYFFNLSEPRSKLLQEAIKEDTSLEKNGRNKLLDVCRTRWLERIYGLEIVEMLFPAVVETLEKMDLNVNKCCNTETSSKARSLFKLLNNFPFIASLVLTRCVLGLTLEVTQLLQSKENDICDGIGLIEAMKENIKIKRAYVDDFHAECYLKVLDLAQRLKIEEKKPRTAGRQLHRDNNPYTNPSDYFKATITIPLLDHISTDLSVRFQPDSLNAYKGSYGIPEKFVSMIQKDPVSKNVWKEKFKTFCTFYKDDLPNFSSLETELSLWEGYWLKYEDSLPANSIDKLKKFPYPGFENIRVALRILATIPITSCECERSFSSLRRLKTFTRSTMSEKRLNGLSLMYIDKDRDPGEDDVINRFASLSIRRVDFRC